MGDRCLIIFAEADKAEARVSPTIYLHWSGSDVPELLEKHKALMGGRWGDVEYAAARFIGLAHGALPGNLSLGVWNTPETMNTPVFEAVATKHLGLGSLEAFAEYSHGDAGVVVVDVRDYSWQAFAGYLVKAEGPEAEGEEVTS